MTSCTKAYHDLARPDHAHVAGPPPPWYFVDMLVRRGAAAVAFMAVPAIVLGCASADDGYFGTTKRVGKPPSTLYINNGAEPEYIDPGKASDTASTWLDYQLFEGLSQAHPGDLHPIPAVAVRWEKSDDNRNYRFHLRPDAKWSDGKPVTAHDFEYAWKRVLRPSTASLAASNLYPLKNGEAFNQSKLKVATSEVGILAEASDGAAVLARLPKGTAFRVLGTSKSQGKTWAEVQRHTELPTFVPAPPPARRPNEGAAAPGAHGEGEANKGEPIGFVPADALAVDDAVVGVRAVDDTTLDVELERPTPYFLDLTTLPTLMPVRRDVVEPFEARGEPELWTRPENIVSNGAYVLSRWMFHYELRLRINPHHYDAAKIKTKEVVVFEAEEAHATMNLYKAGDLDLMGDNSNLPSEYLSFIRPKKDFIRYSFLAAYWYELNTRKPPVDDARVRRALNLAVDKQQLVDRITRGGQTPATHLVPDFCGSGYADELAAAKASGADPFGGPERRFDPELARKLLAEAGYPVVKDGDGRRAQGFPPLEILYNTLEGHKQIAVAIQDMWRRHLGVNVTLRNEEWKVMLKTVRDGQYQIARFGWVAQYNHPNTFLELLLSNNPNNRTGWSDPEFDALMRGAAMAPDPKESMRLFVEAEKRAVDAMPKIPLYFYTKSTLVKPWVKGFVGNARDTHLVKWLWIDPEWEQHGGTSEPAYAPEEYPPPGRIGGGTPYAAGR